MLDFEVEAIHPETGQSKRFRVRCSTVKDAKRAVRRKGHRPGLVRLVDPTEAKGAAYQEATPELSELDRLAEAVAELAGNQTPPTKPETESKLGTQTSPSSTAPMTVQPIQSTGSDRRAEQPLAALPGAARGPSAHKVAWWTVIVSLGLSGMLAVAGIGVVLAALTGSGPGMLALGVGLLVGAILVLTGAQMLRVVIDLSERDPHSRVD